jgi:hypothetical protein
LNHIHALKGSIGGEGKGFASLPLTQEGFHAPCGSDTVILQVPMKSQTKVMVDFPINDEFRFHAKANLRL